MTFTELVECDFCGEDESLSSESLSLEFSELRHASLIVLNILLRSLSSISRLFFTLAMYSNTTLTSIGTSDFSIPLRSYSSSPNSLGKLEGSISSLLSLSSFSSLLSSSYFTILVSSCSDSSDEESNSSIFLRFFFFSSSFFSSSSMSFPSGPSLLLLMTLPYIEH